MTKIEAFFRPRAVACAITAFLVSACGGSDSPAEQAASLPACTELAALLAKEPGVVMATAELQPATDMAPRHCLVNINEGAGNYRLGLPLNSKDGGAGGVTEGAWNGKIQNLGGGGYGGVIENPVIQRTVHWPLRQGYIGSLSDSGHSIAWCSAADPATGLPNSQPNCGAGGGGFVLNAQNKLIAERVYGFIEGAILEQVRLAKLLAKAYYGKEQTRNYWTATSTGGRQGFQLAQKHPELFDGYLLGSSAINWNRFIVSEMWPAIVAKDLLGANGLAPAKSAAATAAAIAACDGDDGVVDGIIGDPLRCGFDATTLACTGNPGDPATCLTPNEANAINLIWDGPRNSRGQRLWGGLTKGTSFDTLLIGGTTPGILIGTYLQNWMYEDPAYDWRRVTMSGLEAEYEFSYYKFRDTASTDTTNLDGVRQKGARIIQFHGLSDPLIVPFGSYNYTHRVFDRYGVANTQSFMRSYFYPGVLHSTGGNGPQPDLEKMFDALQDWVERGIAPEHLVAKVTLPSGIARTRKVCKYPDEPVYSGSGSTDDEASFRCRTNTSVTADMQAAMKTIKD